MVRRRKNPLLVVGIVLGALVVVLAIGGAGAVLLIDPDSLKPRLIEAAEHATGRSIAIGGKLRLAAYLPPTLEAEEVSIGNLPGLSPPAMATAHRVEARIELWPLLARRVVIDRLVLDHPAITLERDAQGTPNWRFSRAPASPSAAPSEPSAAAGEEHARLAIRAIEVHDASVLWRPKAANTAPLKLEIAALTGSTTSADGKLALSADILVGGLPYALTAQTGSIESFAVRDTAAWPLQATLTGAGGARIAVSGTLAPPPAERGYDLVVEAALPDTAAFAQPLGKLGIALPALRDINLVGHIRSGNDIPPELSQFKLQVGHSDLTAIVPGLVLEKADLALANATDRMQTSVQGTLFGAPLAVTGTLGAPSASPFPIDLAIDLGDAKLSAKGAIATPATLSGLDLAVHGGIADLGALGPLANRPLPGLRDIAFHGHLADGPDGERHALLLTAASLTLKGGDLSGDATLLFGPRPKLEATLTSRLIDLDALLGPSPAPARPASAAASPPPPAAPLQPTPGVMDRTLPLDALRLGDADIAFTFGEIRSQGVAWHEIAGHAVLQDGKLTIDPLAAQTRSGRLEATLGVDTANPFSAADPRVALTLLAPGLAIKPVLAAFGLPDETSGALEINADLRGTGATPRALLANAGGRLGLALVDGDIENRTLVALVGDVLRAARLPTDFAGAAHSHLRCFALRLNAPSDGPGVGTATIGALVLDTSRLLLQGSGTLGLSDLGLALRLRPVLRLGSGPGFAVPVRVGGTLRQPKASLDIGGSLEAALTNSALLTGNLQGGRGVSPSGIDRNGDLCPPALAAARNARPGAMPKGAAGGAQGATGDATPTGKINPAALLRDLVR